MLKKLEKSLQEYFEITCSRCGEQGSEHSCPYIDEMNGKNDYTCTCCASCTSQCTQDI
jgi:hypothetical protein